MHLEKCLEIQLSYSTVVITKSGRPVSRQCEATNKFNQFFGPTTE